LWLQFLVLHSSHSEASTITFPISVPVYILPLYADRTPPSAHPITLIYPAIGLFLPVATPNRFRLKLVSIDKKAGGMSQTKAIASINSLLLQLPEPLQVEALYYVEYLNSHRVGVASQTVIII
jgi:hypothetical protein